MSSLRNSLVFVASALCLRAGEIVLPSAALEREGIVNAIYRTNSLVTGKGRLEIRWTDLHGRAVEDRKLSVTLTDENEAPFPLDLRRAAAMKNTLRVRFTLDGVNKKNEPDRRDEQAEIEFLARPPREPWWDYRIVMWQQYPPDRWPALKQIGINAGQYVGRNKPPAGFVFNNDLQWYAENIATDFYAEYHRWRPDRRVNWSYYEAKELYKKDPAGKEAFKRNPSLSDPVWLKKIHDRLVDVTRAQSPYRPIFYDLGDESGIADLSAYWDFDFSDHSLNEMRRWLKERYGALDALNRQWGTSFTAWERVTPETTNQAMKRTDANFSSWADHKEWMDVAFARALKTGVDAIHSVDPSAYVGIAGAQMPGWGGYDYARLTEVLNFFEPYDIGNNIEIIRSIAPGTPVVTTSFARGPSERHRIWYELLHGARGQILWDDKFEFVNSDGTIGPRGAETKPYYTELRGGLAALLINSERQSDPIAIHYSQASFRTDWMLHHQPKGDAWVNRTASSERLDSDFLRLRESYCRLVEDLGLQYDFVSYLQLEAGVLGRRGYRVLILPDSNSLSEREAEAIRDFVGRGGIVVTTSEPGVFDEHSRRLDKPRLTDISAKLARIPGDVLNYHQHRLIGKEAAVYEAARKILAQGAVEPAFRAAEVGVEIHRFRNGGATIVGLLTNPQLRVNELGPPEFKSNQRFEKPRSVRLPLAGDAFVYDVRRGRALGRPREIATDLDPYEPAIYALLPSQPSQLRISAPGRVARGANANISVSIISPAQVHVFHLDVIDPSGKTVDHYSGNLRAPAGRAGKLIPIAYNDPAGKWEIRVRDALTGQSASTGLEVF